jgi:UDP-galactopyranose mutase
MSRFARHLRVIFVEEPAAEPSLRPHISVQETESGVIVAVPQLPSGLDLEERNAALRRLVDRLLADYDVYRPVLWYYTPMARAFSAHIAAARIVYDCMDELSAFRGAPPELIAEERRLLEDADLVFTGGPSLFEAKRGRHNHVYCFPSAVDVHHFQAARRITSAPADQAPIPQPRIGFAGVIDERFDIGLLHAVAERRPSWEFVLLGPVVKIDESTLPRERNIHYLGQKSYAALPKYMSGWRAAIMPFALNEATRYISPTKTPEYLAAGLPVVSTPITDVVKVYGDTGLVHIAATADQFVNALEKALEPSDSRQRLLKVDQVLSRTSWDRTAESMLKLVLDSLVRGAAPRVGEFSGPAVIGRRERARGAFDYLIVGAGFAGSILAERLAAGSGCRVMLIDRRPHIGGNAYDTYDAAGLLIHKYGPHIFHTASERVAAYLSQFTQWRDYEHRVLAAVDNQLLPIPINLTTINQLYGLSLQSSEVPAFLASIAEPISVIRSSEDVVLARVGRDLYEKFFRGYTRKQWGIDPSCLDKAVTARIPTRANQDDRYFTDSFQKMPRYGFTRLFENMLDHPNITIELGANYREVAADVDYRNLIYTGPVDEYFDFRFGKLPYRSLEFRHETHDREWLQPVAVINYPAEQVPWTRVTEYKHLTGQAHAKTSISYEFPTAEGDPYYPVPCTESADLYRKYRELADGTPGVHFVGRLATYKYYNMDQVAAQALTLYDRLTGQRESLTFSAPDGMSPARTVDALT